MGILLLVGAATDPAPAVGGETDRLHPAVAGEIIPAAGGVEITPGAAVGGAGAAGAIIRAGLEEAAGALAAGAAEAVASGAKDKSQARMESIASRTACSGGFSTTVARP